MFIHTYDTKSESRHKLWTLSDYVSVGSFLVKMYHSVNHVDNGGGYAYVGVLTT